MNMLGRVTPMTVTYELVYQLGFWCLVQFVDGRRFAAGPECDTMEQAVREGSQSIGQGRPIAIIARLA